MALVVEVVEYEPFQENTYVVGDPRTRKAWIVDPGGDADRIARVVQAQGLLPEAIVLTHGHIDHVAGAAEAHRRFGAPVWIHPADEAWLRELPMQAMMFGLPPVEVPPVARLLADGEELTLGDQRARVLHTPGHTEGGICLFFAEERSLFTGDTLFVGSVGRTDLPGGDGRALLSSIRGRLLGLGDGVAFYPGHGPGGTLGEERRSNPFVGERAVF